MGVTITISIVARAAIAYNRDFSVIRNFSNGIHIIDMIPSLILKVENLSFIK